MICYNYICISWRGTQVAIRALSRKQLRLQDLRGFESHPLRMKILLTSQGLPKELKDTFLSLLIKSPAENKVSFITTAAFGNEDNPTWLEVYRKQLRDYGVKDIEDLDLKDKKQEELRKILENKDIIFVNGGNTFYLLHWIKKSGFYKVLPKLLRDEKLFIGISAGSYVCGPTIEQANWKHANRNKIGLNDLQGLQMVSFLIKAHFKKSDRPIIEQAAKTCKYPIVGLNDTQAILVEDKRYKLVGKGDREFFNGFEEKL